MEVTIEANGSSAWKLFIEEPAPPPRLANKFYELRFGAAIDENGSEAAALFTGAEGAVTGAGLGLKPPAAGVKAGVND